MYLKTPKKYAAKSRRRLLNLKWLWLYILFPVIVIPAALAWQFRVPISTSIGEWVGRNLKMEFNPPTPTPTIPAADLQARFVSYVQTGSMRNAIAALTSLAEARPNDVEVYARLTRMLLSRDDSQPGREAALVAAQGALNANPEAAEGWVMVGMALNALDRPGEALPYLLRARDFDSRSPAMLATLAETYDLLGRSDRALPLIDDAIEAAKAMSQVDVITLAYAYVVKGRILLATSGDEAVRAFEEAWRVAQTEQTMPLGYIAQWLWSYYFNTDAITKIVDVMTIASDRDKDDPINPYLLGRTYLKTGDNNRALVALERCRDLDPNQVKCLRWLGTMMYRNNNLQRAAELGLRAVELGTDDPGAYLVAGASLAFTSRCAEALPVLQEGLTLAEKSPTYQQLVPQFRDALRSCGGSGVTFASPTPAAP